MLKYAVLILWRKKGVPANFYAFCIYASNPGKSPDIKICWHYIKDVKFGKGFFSEHITEQESLFLPLLSRRKQGQIAEVHFSFIWTFSRSKMNKEELHPEAANTVEKKRSGLRRSPRWFSMPLGCKALSTVSKEGAAWECSLFYRLGHEDPSIPLQDQGI